MMIDPAQAFWVGMRSNPLLIARQSAYLQLIEICLFACVAAVRIFS